VNKVIILIALATFCASSVANESVEVESSYYRCAKTKPGSISELHIGFVIKNTGDTNIRIISKVNSSAIFRVPTDKEQAMVLYHSETVVDGVRFIPTDSELGLVELWPGDGIQIDYKSFSSKSISKKVILSYQSDHVYDDRFQNWVGKVTGAPVNVTNHSACTP
jgi:hypothetical protein